MEWTKQSTKYNIELTVKEFLIITKKDDEDDRDLKDQLFQVLEEKTKNPVEYNGHFGATLFIEIDQKDNNPKFRYQIEKIIQEYIES